MSALAVEVLAFPPGWDGRLVVRAAGRPVLHIGAEGIMAPSVPVFAVALECTPDAERAPGVRPWDGPVTKSAICPACLRSLRGEPELEAPRLVPACVAEALPEPEPEPDRRDRHLQAVPDTSRTPRRPYPTSTPDARSRGPSGNQPRSSPTTTLRVSGAAIKTTVS